MKIKEIKENELPYILDFARNIGLTQRYIAGVLGVRDAIISPWATGTKRPRDYEKYKAEIMRIIDEKMQSDTEEWTAYRRQNR